MKKLVIGVHPNENTMRDPNPHVPWSPEEIAREAAECRDAGASIMHFHGRTPTGAPDHTTSTYAAIARRVRQRTDILLAPSMANATGNTVEERLANVADTASDPRTRSDFLVMDMGCANMDLYDPESRSYRSTGRVYINDVATHLHLFRRARELSLTPYLASFNVSWTRSILAHLDAGVLDEPALIAFILGGPEFVAAHPATVAGLRTQLAFLSQDRQIEWIVSAHRGNVLPVAAAAIELGGHVAIGVGDHHYRELGYPTNAQLIARIVQLAENAGRQVATPEEARQMFGMQRRSHCSS